MAPCGVEGALPLPRRARQPDRRRGEDRADRRARDPACVEGRLDLAERATPSCRRPASTRPGRRQYLYHPDFRARQEQAKFDKLVRFAERLPELRVAMAEHMTLDPLRPRARLRDRGSADQPRLVPRRLRPLREELADATASRRSRSGTCRCAGADRVPLPRQAQLQVRTTLVDAELADAIKELLAQPGGARLFRYGCERRACSSPARVLNDYIQEHLGEEFTAKDFRTWGGTLIAAIALAERGVAETETEAKRVVAAVMRTVGERLGNTPAVARSSYVSPAVVEQYLDGQNDRRFSAAAFARRPRARYRSRSGGAGARQPAALVANQARARGGVISSRVSCIR